MIKQLDIFYPYPMGDGWVSVEFRLYRLHSTDSPFPISKKITHIWLYREKVLKILQNLLFSKNWFQIPQARNTTGNTAFFSFVSIGKKGVQYNDLINFEFAKADYENDNCSGIRFPSSRTGTIADFERVAKSGFSFIRPPKPA